MSDSLRKDWQDELTCIRDQIIMNRAFIAEEQLVLHAEALRLALCIIQYMEEELEGTR